jgi:EAL domain-containing protein (putative c-di-GMP-specific phosphodiesterase class I)
MSQAALSQHAHRVVFELTERRSLDHVPGLTERVAQLRALGYRVAIDNLGVGYAGLGSFNSLEPDFVKLDMALIRDIETSKRKQSLVRSLNALCSRELGIHAVCVGVETQAERDTLVSLGANLMQGYLFGRPQEGFAPVTFESCPDRPK